MPSIIYTLELPFMRKTFEAIDRHLDRPSAYVPLRPDVAGEWDGMDEIPPDDFSLGAIEAAIAGADPEVVVRNHRYRLGEFETDHDYALVHVRHGASVGRGEVENTVAPEMAEILDVALAPGERWARRYRVAFPDRVRVATVGVPEADDLVDAEPPRERRVLYAPTNHNYGGGSYLHTAEAVLDCFADSAFELRFRPHPADRTEEPGRSLTERCRERIEGLPNVTFDANPTPGESLREADVLLSDYSGIVVEWLHADRPLVQLSDVDDGTNEVPDIGHVTGVDRLEERTIERLYAHGHSPEEEARRTAFVASLGVPMDGRAGERAAGEVVACTQ